MIINILSQCNIHFFIECLTPKLFIELSLLNIFTHLNLKKYIEDHMWFTFNTRMNLFKVYKPKLIRCNTKYFKCIPQIILSQMQRLKMYGSARCELIANDLPKTLHHLYLNRVEEPIINTNSFGDNIRYLELPDVTNEKIDRWSVNMHTLKLGSKYNHELDDLPISLTSLTLGQQYNQNIDFLPKFLSKLTLGRNFNKKIHDLPPSLTYLHINNNENMSDILMNLRAIPHSIRVLKLHDNYNRMIANLPRGLEELQLGFNFNNTLDLKDTKIISLTLGDVFNNHIYNIPKTLRFLQLGNSFNKPLALQDTELVCLRLGEAFDNCLSNPPLSLVSLSFGRSSKNNYLQIPPSVKTLHVKNYHTALCHIPATVSSLYFGNLQFHSHQVLIIIADYDIRIRYFAHLHLFEKRFTTIQHDKYTVFELKKMLLQAGHSSIDILNHILNVTEACKNKTLDDNVCMRDLIQGDHPWKSVILYINFVQMLSV